MGSGTYITNLMEKFGRQHLGVQGLTPRALRKHWAGVIDSIDPVGQKGIKALAAKAMGTSVKVLNEK